MTKQEHETLLEILTTNTWQSRTKALEYVKSITPTEGGTVASSERTGSQNNAMHLWFQQIADICQNQGVTMNLIIKHTHDVQVTQYAVKALWHVLQKALYGTESTKELKKHGQIDRMIDHFTALFAKEEVELPPFPFDPKKNNIKLTAVENLKSTNYPTYDQAPTL